MHLSIGSQLGSGVCITLPQAQYHDSAWMKILLEMGARECMQKHSQRTWISISFMTFALMHHKGRAYKRQEAALSKAPGQRCGAHTRDSSNQYSQDWGGVSNPSLTSLKLSNISIHHVLQWFPLSKNQKYWCICAMSFWSPKFWLPWAVPEESQLPGDNIHHPPVCQLFRKLYIQAICMFLPTGQAT